MKNICHCAECEAERILGKSAVEFTPEEVTNMGLGCAYCAMTGYEDYPRNNVPCRVGHVGNITASIPHSSASSMDWTAFQPLPDWMLPPEPKEGKPTVGGPWKWTGSGWQNLGYKKDTIKLTE